MEIKILQIYYNEESKQKLDPAFTPYDNEGRFDQFFENAVIEREIRIIGNGNLGSYCAILSWQVTHKSPYFFNHPERRGKDLIETIHNGTADIYALSYSEHDNNPFLEPTYHPNMHRIIELIFKELNPNLKIEQFYLESTIYMNHFVAKSTIYKAYVETWLSPIMKIMKDKSNGELQRLLWQDSLYKSDLTHEEKVRFWKQIGVPYYPLHSFICERLFSLWLALFPGRFKIEYLR